MYKVKLSKQSDVKLVRLFICSLIGPSHCRDTDDLLAFTNPEVRKGFEDFLLPTESDRSRAHLALAGKVHPVLVLVQHTRIYVTVYCNL